MGLFPEASNMDFPALIFMMIVYGYILLTASQLIGSGSEMLLLMYGPGIIGGLLIPILGAVPDCAVILVSGLGGGSKEEIQNELSVGVGALVGSTVMLLTLPWAISVYLGRRDLDSRGQVKNVPPKTPKVTHFSLRTNGVGLLDEISGTAKVMMIASLSYLIIQVPAFFFSKDQDKSSEEAPFALVGMIISFLGFAIYCYYQYASAKREEILKLQQEAIRREQWKKGLDSKLSTTENQELIFRKHDKDRSGYMDASELKSALAELGFTTNRTTIQKLLQQIDTGHKDDGDEGKVDGKISLNEFKHAINTWIKEGRSNKENLNEMNNIEQSLAINNGDVSQEHEKEEKLVDSIEVKNDEKENIEEIDEEEEEEYLHLTDSQIKFKACALLMIGTGVCTVFSDPMVDVISTVGSKMNISPFYISFVVTPLVSNASEVIAGLMFAKKKTTESISLSLATLHGAATMNSTLALGIFMSLIYFRGLSWSFSAEVITVLVIIFFVGLNSLKKTVKLWQALLIALLYPFSILLVYILEGPCGLD